MTFFAKMKGQSINIYKYIYMHVSEQSKSLPPIQPPPHCPKNCSSVASLHRHRDSLQEEFSAAGLSGGFAEASSEVSHYTAFDLLLLILFYCKMDYCIIMHAIIQHYLPYSWDEVNNCLNLAHFGAFAPIIEGYASPNYKMPEASKLLHGTAQHRG